MAVRATALALLLALLTFEGEAAKRIKGSGSSQSEKKEQDEPIPGLLWNTKITAYMNDANTECPFSSLSRAGGITGRRPVAEANGADDDTPDECNVEEGGNPANCQCFDQSSLRSTLIGGRAVSFWEYPRQKKPANSYATGKTCIFCEDRIIVSTDRLHRERCTTLGDQMCRKFRRQAALGLTQGSFMWFVVNDKFGDPKLEQYESMKLECLPHKKTWHWLWEKNFWFKPPGGGRYVSKWDLKVGDNIQYKADHKTLPGATGIIGCRRPFRAKATCSLPLDQQKFLPDKTGAAPIQFADIPNEVIELEEKRRIRITFHKGWSCGSSFTRRVVTAAPAPRVPNTTLSAQQRIRQLRLERIQQREASRYRPPPMQVEEYDLDTCFKREWRSTRSLGPLHTSTQPQIFHPKSLNFTAPNVKSHLKDISFFISSTVCERRHSLKMQFLQYFAIATLTLYIGYFPWYAVTVWGFCNKECNSCLKCCNNRVNSCIYYKDRCCLIVEDWTDTCAGSDEVGYIHVDDNSDDTLTDPDDKEYIHGDEAEVEPDEYEDEDEGGYEDIGGAIEMTEMGETDEKEALMMDEDGDVGESPRNQYSAGATTTGDTGDTRKATLAAD